MEKKVSISGMTCPHCAARVEKALSALGVPVKVYLKDNCAWVPSGLDNDQIIKAISDAGYTVTKIG